nr:nicotinate phosphoribosyltransferase [Lachnospiraceae bacterium]
DPVFGAVYKICEVQKNGECIPKIKVSETIEKITNPGRKSVYRIYDNTGQAIADLITKAGEKPDLSKPYRYVDPEKPWKVRVFENCTARELQQPVIRGGKRVDKTRSLSELKAFVEKQLKDEIWEEEQRFENPHKHYLDMSPEFYEMKMDLLLKNPSDL